MIIFLITAAVIILDQFTKNMVRNNLFEGESIPIIQNIFHFTHVKNTGAAFSIFQGQYLITIGIPIILIIICVIFLVKHNKSMHISLKISVPLIIGGGLGNLYDRIVYGYVTDMFDFRVFPVFNVADIAVCIGCALLIIFVIFYDKEEEIKSNEVD